MIEDFAIARYNGANQVVTIKGVGDNFMNQDRIPKESIVEGELLLKKNGVNRALVGYGVRSTLSIALDQDFYPLQLYYVKNERGSSLIHLSCTIKKTFFLVAFFPLFRILMKAM